MDGVADRADAGSGFVRPRQQLMRVLRRAPRTVRIADAMAATLLAQMLAQQLAGVRIEQPNIHRIPLHMNLPPDPARRSSVESRFNFHAAIEVTRSRRFSRILPPPQVLMQPTSLATASGPAWRRMQG